jgi:hypothetical protein
MSKLSHIFSTYIEAYIAVFLSLFALLELAAFISSPDQSRSYIFLIASVVFTAIAVYNVRCIVRREHKRSR